MTRVDFYILAEAQPQARLRFACRLVDKASQLGHRVHLHTDSETDSRQLDELLWTFRQDSFLAHGILTEGGDPGPVVACIGHGPDWPEADLLVNLAGEIPPFFSRYDRVMEIVTRDPATTETGRLHYRFYRDRGYPLTSHDLRESAP